MAITLTEVVNKVLVKQYQQSPQLAVSNEVLGTIASAASVAGTAVKEIAGNKSAQKAAAAAVSGNVSLTEYTQAANLEPRVMVEETLRTLPNLDKWLMTLTNLYSAYYLQATALGGTVAGVSVMSQLDKFNPNRNPTIAAVDAINNYLNPKPSKESYLDYGYVLPKFNKEENLGLIAPASKLAIQLSQEANNNNKNNTGNKTTNIENQTINNDNSNHSNIFGDQTNNKVTINEAPPTNREIVGGLKQIQDVDNLAVGRLLEVVLMINGQNVKVPVSVRMRPMSVPKLIMRELVAEGDIRNSWKERWHRMRAGELSLVSDWIFQSDRIKEKRRLMALDKQGLYKEMIERRRNAKASAAITGHVSIGAASAFMIISKATAKEVELRTGMKIENDEFRKRVFSENSAMMIMVVDTEWETIDAYTRGVPGVANWTFKQFEGMSKGNGPDITEIMKAYTMGQNPRF